MQWPRLQSGVVSPRRYQTETWNEWRRQHPKICPNLSNAVLNSLASKSTLDSEKYIFRHFQKRDFQGLDLHDADLHGAKLWNCDLSGVDLRGANLSGAEVRRSQLKNADLRGADLRNTQFLRSDLSGAQLEGSTFGKTHFGFTTLTNIQGLTQVQHRDKSDIDQFSIIASMPLPTPFLSACGVPAHTVRMAELYTRSHSYYTCFISYSRRDTLFVSKLRDELTRAGVPSWFAPQDMRDEKFQSDKVELERDLDTYVDAAERVLLVISPNILASNWVGKEFQRALSFTSVIPILIENMPVPGSPAWDTPIAQTMV